MTTCWTLLPDIARCLLSTHLQLTVTQQKISDNQKRDCALVSADTSLKRLDSLCRIPCCSECSLPLRAGLHKLDSHTVMVSFSPLMWGQGAFPWATAEDYRVFTHYFITLTSTTFIIPTWPPSSFSCPTFARVLAKLKLTRDLLSSPIKVQFFLIST